MHNPIRQQEALHPTWVLMMWQKIAIDVQHMPMDNGKNYLVEAWCDFSGWVEVWALQSADVKSIAKFLWEDIICWHGIPESIVMDGGPENWGVVEELMVKYKIK